MAADAQTTSAQSEGTPADSQPSPRERVWQVVAMIPAGKVATYGQVAALAGIPSHSRYVGRTLSELPAGTRLPWHRVVNASLRSSLPPTSAAYELQMDRLRADRVSFIGTRVAPHHRWEP